MNKIICSICYKKKKNTDFRKNRKQCIKCEYATRKEYHKKYKIENKDKLKIYRKNYNIKKYVKKKRIIKNDKIIIKNDKKIKSLKLIIYI